MRSPFVYLDSSALVKLVSPEPETAALVAALARWPERVSSALARVELLRALRRARLPQSAFRRADQVLSAIALVHVDEMVLSAASALRSPSLRSLDAIHLATAQSIGDMPDAFITYDDRLAAAARASGFPVLAPGL